MPCFNPCCRGSRRQHRLHTSRRRPQSWFQSLLSWIARRQRTRSAVTEAARSVSILVVVDLARVDTLMRRPQPIDRRPAFQSLLSWISRVSDACAERGPIRRAVFQSLLSWICAASTHDLPRPRRIANVSILVVVDLRRVDRSATLPRLVAGRHVSILVVVDLRRVNDPDRPDSATLAKVSILVVVDQSLTACSRSREIGLAVAVSILVVVDWSRQRRHAASRRDSGPTCFNPCCRGSVASHGAARCRPEA